MKNYISINNKKIELTNEQVCEIKKQLCPEPKIIWDLKVGDKYWYINSNGYVYLDKWCNNAYENDRRNAGNIFPTQAEAETELSKRQAITRVLKWKHDNGLDFEPDWEDGGQKKYSIYYDCENEGFDWIMRYSAKHYSPIGHFKSSEDMEKCIEECEEDLSMIYD